MHHHKYDTWLSCQTDVKDFSEVSYYINEFERLKKQKQIRGIDINKIDFNDLKKLVKDNSFKISRKAIEKGNVDLTAFGKYGIRVYTSVDDYESIVKYGKKTEWCTDNKKDAKEHLKMGVIYVITKNEKPYAQLQPETNQYMDRYNEPIKLVMWGKLRKNIPFINQLVHRMGIFDAMSWPEVYSWIERQGPRINCDLDLRKFPVTHLPEGIVNINGCLFLQGTQVTKLPDSLKSVSGHLDLSETKITKLPDSLERVGGYLNLRGTPLSKKAKWFFVRLITKPIPNEYVAGSGIIL